MFLAGLLFLFLGAAFVVFLLLGMRGERAQLRRMAMTPTIAIAGAPSGALIELVGTVELGEQGAVTSPAGVRQAVLYHASVLDDESTEIHVAKDRRDFWLVDDAGDRARIAPEGSAMVSRSTQYGDYFDHVAIRVGEMPQQRADMTLAILGWAQKAANSNLTRLLVQEIVIAPGDRLYVLGWGERDAAGVLTMRAGEGRELFLSTYSEAELADVYRQHLGKLRLVIAVMLLFCVAGVVLLVLS